MSSVVVSAIVFGCLIAAWLVASFVKKRLPDHHLDSESRDVVKLGMGLIATLSALVLGLLIATAKGNYDTQAAAVNELSASYLLLDRVLARYGPETKEGRDLLKVNVADLIERTWPTDPHQGPNLSPNDSKRTLEKLYDMISALDGSVDSRRELRGRALTLITDIGQARLRLYARQDSSLPTAFLVVLVIWLMVLFFGYALLAPSNGTVAFVLLTCALSVSAAIFLMLELSTPFAGVMRVSSTPMQNVLGLLGQS